MEADDDMIVVIVGDNENEELPELVKEEVLDSDEVEKLIETAATHGELVDISLKEKLEQCEDNNDEEGVDGDEEYVPEEDDEGDMYFDDVNDSSGNEAHNRHRYKMLQPAQQKSFVKELRDQYPELEDNIKPLVTTLSEIMKNVRPPPPPQDYFIMNGIMFECVTCGTISESQPAAGRHYQEKHGERYLICFACGVDFRCTSNLYKHEKRCVAPDAAVVLKARARVLGRNGRSKHHKSKRPRHLKKPSERKFACSQCPAAFVAKKYLQSHEMLHRGLRPYTCDICPCAYTSMAALSRHRKKHSDEQYICDHCGRAFKMKAALVMHMDTHLPVKKFGCDECERRYATKAALVRHGKRKHLKTPGPCVCTICFKRYALMSALRNHTKKAHGLQLMTRKMFFQTLPTLTDTQIEQAKVVLKSEVEPDYSYTLQPLENTLPPSESPVVYDGQLPDESSDHTQGIPGTVEPVFKEEPDNEDSASAEQSIVLSGEVLQLMHSTQGEFDDGEVLNLNYAEIPQELLASGQLVLYNGEYLLQTET